MVSLQEAIQQVKTAETSAQQREREILEAEQRVKRLGRGGLAQQITAGSRFQEVRKAEKIAKKKTLAETKRAREELSSFRVQIEGTKSQIAQIQAQEREQQSLLSDIRAARKFAERGRFPFGESKRVRKLFVLSAKELKAREQRQEQLRALKSEGLTPVFVGGKLTSFESEELQQSISLQELPLAKPESILTLEKAGVITVEKVSQKPVINIQDLLPPQMSRVELKDPTFKERVQQFALAGSELAARQVPFIGVPGFGVKEPKEVTEFRAGFTSALIPTTKEEAVLTAATFGAGTLIGGGLKVGAIGLRAIGGTKAVMIGEGVVGVGGVGLGGLFAFETGKKVISAEDSFGRGEIVGGATRELASLGVGTKIGGTGVVRVQDIIRTRGLTELPAERVIAPEFFEGQVFPQIKRGQTPKELRSEFLEAVLPGESPGIPRGFTARSEALPEIIPPSRGGPGELVGLFQAPRVSPTFLRVSRDEPRLAGFTEFLGGELPLVARVQPSTLEFAPGVSPTQRFPKPLGFSSKEFSEQIAGTGRSIIPFIKTEKEAVIAIKTPLELTGERFFFKFEGRRIPIREFRTTPLQKDFFPAQRDLIKPSTFRSLVSSSRLGKRSPLVSPKEFLGASLSSSVRGISRSSFLPSRKGRPKESRGFSLLPRRGSFSISGFIPTSSSSSITTRTSEIIFPSLPPFSNRFDIRSSKKSLPEGRDIKPSKKKKKIRRGRLTSRLAPSFTAQVLNLRGALPKEFKISGRSLGILPGRIRTIPI